MLFSEKVISFHTNLRIPEIVVPEGFTWIFPYDKEETIRCLTAFYQKYYADEQKRHFIFGINPGRFGAGLTGVPFTDPVKLKSECGISNCFPTKPELSADFIWQTIRAYGGVEAFTQSFYITSLSPLGFLRNGLNVNYYDDRRLAINVEPFIVESLRKQMSFGSLGDTAICLGEGKNFEYFRKLNKKEKLFYTSRRQVLSMRE